jgi:hypothetical protein
VLGGHTDRFWPWTITSSATTGFLVAAYGAGFLLSRCCRCGSARGPTSASRSRRSPCSPSSR